MCLKIIVLGIKILRRFLVTLEKQSEAIVMSYESVAKLKRFFENHSNTIAYFITKIILIVRNIFSKSNLIKLIFDTSFIQLCQV